MNLSKSLFESQYRPIAFKKPDNAASASDKQAVVQAGRAEDVREFYDSLINAGLATRASEPASAISSAQSATSSSPTRKTARTKKPALGEKAFLSAVQNGDVEALKDHFDGCAALDDALALLETTDQYKWNCLMISAAAASGRQVLALLLDYFVEQTGRLACKGDVESAARVVACFERLAGAKDDSGSDAERIARKVRNQAAVELIHSTRVKLQALTASSNRNTPLDEASIADTSMADKVSFFCSTCGESFDETEAQHVASMVHLLNEGNTSTASRANYYLRSSNIGYQMLCKQGWNEQRGLGAKEQGTIYPVKAKIKHDRLGIGVPAPTTSFSLKSSSQQPVNLANKPIRLKRAVRRGDAVLMQAVKAEAKRPRRLEKEKEFAKNFRLYYNQN